MIIGMRLLMIVNHHRLSYKFQLPIIKKKMICTTKQPNHYNIMMKNLFFTVQELFM